METILSIAGKPGLYKLVSRGNRNLIVEAIDETHKRIPAFASDRVTSLADIAMYTDAEDIPLWKVFKSLGEKENSKECSLNYKKCSAKELHVGSVIGKPGFCRQIYRLRILLVLPELRFLPIINKKRNCYRCYNRNDHKNNDQFR